MKISLLLVISLMALSLLQSGCAKPIPLDPAFASIDGRNLPEPNLAIEIPGLSSCTTEPDSTLHLNSGEPVTVIVHGCFASAGLFRSLSQVFAFHGQQTACFNYDDRDSLMESSAELIEALSQLSAKMDKPEITVIGHSQGGLISRKALIEERDDKLIADDTKLRLVSISAPYSGIAAADHCSSFTARMLSFGLVVPICRLISGEKWHEITQPSPFIQKPGRLLDQVTTHLKIVTDEADSCRSYDANGSCTEADFVFTTEEQYFNGVDASSRVDNVEVSAGHAEIVGTHSVIPTKLIDLMQSKGIMASTPPAYKEKLSLLLSRLYRH